MSPSDKRFWLRPQNRNIPVAISSALSPAATSERWQRTLPYFHGNATGQSEKYPSPSAVTTRTASTSPEQESACGWEVRLRGVVPATSCARACVCPTQYRQWRRNALTCWPHHFMRLDSQTKRSKQLAFACPRHLGAYHEVCWLRCSRHRLPNSSHPKGNETLHQKIFPATLSRRLVPEGK